MFLIGGASLSVLTVLFDAVLSCQDSMKDDRIRVTLSWDKTLLRRGVNLVFTNCGMCSCWRHHLVRLHKLTEVVLIMCLLIALEWRLHKQGVVSSNLESDPTPKVHDVMTSSIRSSYDKRGDVSSDDE